jgi:hypothetical protein
MKLTLRTLLAWLDDTLPTGEVRHIGQQVHESSVASDLVARIHRVTRRRRLTVPHSTGPDGTDPNEVAAYLDNLLGAEAVAAFEKRCLKSDVHLAEVASVHQILSLLGQKAKVPPEARQRMYHLIKGREVARDDEPRAFRPPKPEPANPAPPWASTTPRRSWVERFGPAAAVLILVGLLAWSTWAGLGLSGADNRGDRADLAANAGPPSPPAPNPQAKVAPRPEAGAGADSGAGAGEGARAEPETEATDDSARPEAQPHAEVMVEPTDGGEQPAAAIPAAPAGSLGSLVEDAGIVLHESDGEGESDWERATTKTALKSGDKLVGLDPYRNPLELGGGKVTLVKGTAVQLHVPGPGAVARLALLEGRLTLRGTDPPKPFAIGLGESVVEVTPPAGGLVGIERVNALLEGKPEPAAPYLLLHAASGPVKLGGTGGSETLAESEGIRINADGTFQGKASEPAPAWVTESQPSPLDAEAGAQFARFFRPDAPAVTSLAEATVDERPEIRKFAIEALGTIGEVMLVVGALNTEGGEQAGQVRRAAIAAMRSILARGGEPAQELRDELASSGGSQEWADEALKLLSGYTVAEAAEESTQAHLVELLAHPDVGIRELALWNLKEISNRGDNLGYDPENPEGPGLKSWQDLLNRGQLRQAPARR